MWLTRWALREPLATALFFALVTGAGVAGWLTLGRNVIPAVAFPSVTVSARYPGAAASEMERTIVIPIEDRLDAVRGVDRVSSTVQNDLATITVRLRLAADVDRSIGDIRAAIDSARPDLPPDFEEPLVARADPQQTPILLEAVSAPGMAPRDLGRLVDDRIVPALRRARGAGSVSTIGETPRELVVEPDPARLAAVGATPGDLLASLAAANERAPGGRLDDGTAETELAIRADAEDAAALARAPLLVNGFARPGLGVGTLATIVDGSADRRTFVDVDGEDALIVGVARADGADTVGTTRRLRAVIGTLAAQLPGVRFRQIRADDGFVDTAVNGVLQNLLEGVVLTVVVMLALLRSLRSATIAAVAIPTSIAATFSVMRVAGLSINVLSLMGLSLTIGILVDDSIVIVESIAREAPHAPTPEAAALAGRREIGSAAIAITFVDVVVFAPIAFAGGIIGGFMREFAVVVCAATLFSLLVSFTLTPLLASHWGVGAVRRTASRRLPGALRRARAALPILVAAASAPSRAVERLRSLYADRWLPVVLRRPRTVVAVGVATVVVALAPVLNGAIPTEFQPYVAQGTATIDLTFPPGTPLTVSARGARALSAALGARGDVAHVATIVGIASNGSTDVAAGNVAQLIVTLRPWARGRELDIIREARGDAALVPAVTIRGAGQAMGGVAPIAYTLTGDEGAVRVAAARIAARLRSLPTTTDVRDGAADGTPRRELVVDRGRSSVLGIALSDASTAERVAYGGEIATRLHGAGEQTPVIVRLAPGQRHDLAALSRLMVRASDGTLVPLRSITTIRVASAASVLLRENRRRIVSVTAAMQDGAPIGLATRVVDQALRTRGFLPPGAAVARRGDAEQLDDTMRQMMLTVASSIVLVYMLLALTYRDLVTPLVVLCTVPLAAIGALGTLWMANLLHGALPTVSAFAGQTLNFYSMLGIVMLSGLVAKNGILLIDNANRRLRAGADPRDAIVGAAERRFRAILMTTLAMIAGMLPLALGVTEGAAFRKALATVVIGGLISSLALTLAVLPVVWLALVGRRRASP